MASLLSKYFMLMSLAGFCTLIVLAILAFCDNQFLKIRKGANAQSGIILMIVAIIYGFIAMYLFYRETNLEKSPRRGSEITGNNINQGSINE
jgi:hypothetical protein